MKKNKVFTLKVGMRLVIYGLVYKVRTVRHNGKCVIQYTGMAIDHPHMQALTKKPNVFHKIKKFFRRKNKK